MCIRDRFLRQAEHGRGLAAAAREADNITANQPQRLAQVHGCLLYTSDAADERSSVDLGGRRIIKKKKNDTTQGSELLNRHRRDATVNYGQINNITEKKDY